MCTLSRTRDLPVMSDEFIKGGGVKQLTVRRVELRCKNATHGDNVDSRTEYIVYIRINLLLDTHFNMLLSSSRRETATSRCLTRRLRRCPRRSRCCCKAGHRGVRGWCVSTTHLLILVRRVRQLAAPPPPPAPAPAPAPFGHGIVSAKLGSVGTTEVCAGRVKSGHRISNN